MVFREGANYKFRVDVFYSKLLIVTNSEQSFCGNNALPKVHERKSLALQEPVEQGFDSRFRRDQHFSVCSMTKSINRRAISCL